MKKAIETRADIEALVNHFYSKVQKDKTIGYIFDDVARVNWELHLPKMYAFWESILFGGHHYRGNPMVTHIELNRKEQLLPKHFEQWVHLFQETIDELFEGEKAEEAKLRAHAIAGIMQIKVHQSTM